MALQATRNSSLLHPPIYTMKLPAVTRILSGICPNHRRPRLTRSGAESLAILPNIWSSSKTGVVFSLYRPERPPGLIMISKSPEPPIESNIKSRPSVAMAISIHRLFRTLLPSPEHFYHLIKNRLNRYPLTRLLPPVRFFPIPSTVQFELTCTLLPKKSRKSRSMTCRVVLSKRSTQRPAIVISIPSETAEIIRASHSNRAFIS